MTTDYMLKCSLGLDGPVFDVDDDDMNSSVAVAFTDDQYTGSSATPTYFLWFCYVHVVVFMEK